MESELAKISIGEIPEETTEEDLRGHFGKYGHVVAAEITRSKFTSLPSGFGYVIFEDASVIDAVMLDLPHEINERRLAVRRAMTLEESQIILKTKTLVAMETPGGGCIGPKTDKIFVGSLPPNLTEEEFREYFESYGKVTEAVIMYDKDTLRRRGFGFITFDTEHAVAQVFKKKVHELKRKCVEIKKALPDESFTSRANAATSRPETSSASRMLAMPSFPPRPPVGVPPRYGVPNYGNILPPAPAPTYGVPNYGSGPPQAPAPTYGVPNYGSIPPPAPAPTYGVTNYGSAPPPAPWNNQAPSNYPYGTYGVTNYDNAPTQAPSNNPYGTYGVTNYGNAPPQAQSNNPYGTYGVTNYGNAPPMPSNSYQYGTYGTSVNYAAPGAWNQGYGYGGSGAHSYAPAGGSYSNQGYGYTGNQSGHWNVGAPAGGQQPIAPPTFPPPPLPVGYGYGYESFGSQGHIYYPKNQGGYGDGRSQGVAPAGPPPPHPPGTDGSSSSSSSIYRQHQY